MKLLLTALCASFMVIPAAFSAECEKGKCDKEKQEEGTLAHCGKCDKDKEKEGDEKKEGTVAGADCDKCKKGDDAKEEGTLAGADCDKCKKGDDAKEEGTLAHCGKCGKDKDKEGDEEKKEGTLA